MKKPTTLSEQTSLLLFLILTPLICLAIALFLPLPAEVIALLILLIISTMAVLCTVLEKGLRGVSELLKKLLEWRISLRWYLVATLLPVGIILASGVVAFFLGWIPRVRYPCTGFLATDLQFDPGHTHCGFGGAGLEGVCLAEIAQIPIAFDLFVDHWNCGGSPPHRSWSGCRSAVAAHVPGSSCAVLDMDLVVPPYKGQPRHGRAVPFCDRLRSSIRFGCTASHCPSRLGPGNCRSGRGSGLDPVRRHRAAARSREGNGSGGGRLDLIYVRRGIS